jgi:DNA-binding transcriptional LysR family regulator
MTLTGLRLIGEVAALGSFTAAAESLGYTQSAVSRQATSLEAAVGTPLFQREARGVSLTPAGSVLARHAASILAGVEAAEDELAGLRDRLAGRITVGAFPTAAAVLVPRAIARLRTEHPGLVVVLKEGSSPTQLRRLRAGRIDVAVIGVGSGLQPYDLNGLRHDVLVKGDLCLAVPATHRFARRARVPVGELSTESWIIGVGATGEPQFEAWPTLRTPHVAYTAREWPTRFGLVAAGLGICVLPELAAAAVPAGVGVVGVDDPGWLGRSTVAVTRTEPTAGASAAIHALHAEANGLRTVS